VLEEGIGEDQAGGQEDQKKAIAVGWERINRSGGENVVEEEGKTQQLFPYNIIGPIASVFPSFTRRMTPRACAILMPDFLQCPLREHKRLVHEPSIFLGMTRTFFPLPRTLLSFGKESWPNNGHENIPAHLHF
jgi:hypothetical protein